MDQIPVSHPAICSCTKSCRLRCFVVYPVVSLPFQNFPHLPLWKRIHTKHTNTFMLGHQQIKPAHMLQVLSAIFVFLRATAVWCVVHRMHRHHKAIRSLAGKLHSLFNTFINSPLSLPPPQASPRSHDLSRLFKQYVLNDADTHIMPQRARPGWKRLLCATPLTHRTTNVVLHLLISLSLFLFS